jgi:hypothetical protein
MLFTYTFCPINIDYLLFQCVAAIIPSDNNKIRFVAGLLMLTATYVIGDMYSASLTSILARPPKGNHFQANYCYFNVGKIILSDGVYWTWIVVVQFLVTTIVVIVSINNIVSDL